jgi:hypothetical protein
MKKTNITFPYDEEKLNAVKLFIAQKDSDFSGELVSFMEQLYKKNVPANVREFISLKNGEAAKKPKQVRADGRGDGD